MKTNKTIELYFDKEDWLEAMEKMQKANYESGYVSIITSFYFQAQLLPCYTDLCEELIDSMHDLMDRLYTDYPEEAYQFEFAYDMRYEEIDYADFYYKEALDSHNMCERVASEMFEPLLGTLYYLYIFCKTLEDILNVCIYTSNC